MTSRDTSAILENSPEAYQVEHDKILQPNTVLLKEPSNGDLIDLANDEEKKIIDPLMQWFSHKFSTTTKFEQRSQNRCDQIICPVNRIHENKNGHIDAIERKIVILNKSPSRQMERKVQGGHDWKMVRQKLEISLSKKRRIDLEKHKELYEQDNLTTKSDNDEDDEEDLTDSEEEMNENGAEINCDENDDEKLEASEEFSIIEKSDDVRITSDKSDNESSSQLLNPLMEKDAENSSQMCDSQSWFNEVQQKSSKKFDAKENEIDHVQMANSHISVPISYVASETFRNSPSISRSCTTLNLHIPESLSQWAVPSQASSPQQQIRLSSFGLTSFENSIFSNELLSLCSGVFPSSASNRAELDTESPQHCSKESPFTEDIPRDRASHREEIRSLDPSQFSDDAARDGFESDNSIDRLSNRRRILRKKRKRTLSSDDEDEQNNKIIKSFHDDDADDDGILGVDESNESQSHGNDNDANSDGNDANSDGNDANSDDNDANSDDDDANSDDNDANSDDNDANSDDNDANSDDDEMAVFRRIRMREQQDVRKRIIGDFIDEEAELSDSDIGSGDEELDSDQDEYEAEEGDKDEVPDEEELRDQLQRVVRKQQRDEDERQLVAMRERLFEDGDLHRENGANRQFRWTARQDVDEQIDEENCILPSVDQVDLETDKNVHQEPKDKTDKVRWRHNREDICSDDEVEYHSDSQLAKVGLIAVQRKKLIESPNESTLGFSSFLNRKDSLLSMMSNTSTVVNGQIENTSSSTLFVSMKNEQTKRQSSSNNGNRNSKNRSNSSTSSVSKYFSVFDHF